jgi:hypothetical protein
VTVIQELFAPCADLTNDIPLPIKPHMTEAQAGHLFGNSFPNCSNLAVHARNGDDLFQESENSGSVFLYPSVDLREFLGCVCHRLLLLINALIQDDNLGIIIDVDKAVSMAVGIREW